MKMEVILKGLLMLKGQVKQISKAPAVILINPKYPHNVGHAVRACACWR